MSEPAEVSQKRAHPRMLGIGSGLPQIAGAEHNNVRFNLFQLFIIQTLPFHDTWGEVFSDDISPILYNSFSNFCSFRMSQVKRNPVFIMTVDGKVIINTG